MKNMHSPEVQIIVSLRNPDPSVRRRETQRLANILLTFCCRLWAGHRPWKGSGLLSGDWAVLSLDLLCESLLPLSLALKFLLKVEMVLGNRGGEGKGKEESPNGARTHGSDPAFDADWLCLLERAFAPRGFGFLIWTSGTDELQGPTQMTSHE